MFHANDQCLIIFTALSEPYEAAPEVYYSGWGCSGSPLSGEEDAPSLTSRSATASHTDPPAHMHMLPTDARTGKTKLIFILIFFNNDKSKISGTVLLQDGIGKQEMKMANDNKKRRSLIQGNIISIDKEAQSDNYSLRSSAEVIFQFLS